MESEPNLNYLFVAFAEKGDVGKPCPPKYHWIPKELGEESWYEIKKLQKREGELTSLATIVNIRGSKEITIDIGWLQCINRAQGSYFLWRSAEEAVSKK
ncbi:MAG: hypothetical protein ABIJ14_04085 [Nanoarchaeota archaeon]|nr:hypothetical protein [Nanoarchaeota archaeon]